MSTGRTPKQPHNKIHHDEGPLYPIIQPSEFSTQAYVPFYPVLAANETVQNEKVTSTTFAQPYTLTAHSPALLTPTATPSNKTLSSLEEIHYPVITPAEKFDYKNPNMPNAETATNPSAATNKPASNPTPGPTPTQSRGIFASMWGAGSWVLASGRSVAANVSAKIARDGAVSTLGQGLGAALSASATIEEVTTDLYALKESLRGVKQNTATLILSYRALKTGLPTHIDRILHHSMGLLLNNSTNTASSFVNSARTFVVNQASLFRFIDKAVLQTHARARQLRTLEQHSNSLKKEIDSLFQTVITMIVLVRKIKQGIDECLQLGGNLPIIGEYLSSTSSQGLSILKKHMDKLALIAQSQSIPIDISKLSRLMQFENILNHLERSLSALLHAQQSSDQLINGVRNLWQTYFLLMANFDTVTNAIDIFNITNNVVPMTNLAINVLSDPKEYWQAFFILHGDRGTSHILMQPTFSWGILPFVGTYLEQFSDRIILRFSPQILSLIPVLMYLRNANPIKLFESFKEQIHSFMNAPSRLSPEQLAQFLADMQKKLFSGGDWPAESADFRLQIYKIFQKMLHNTELKKALTNIIYNTMIIHAGNMGGRLANTLTFQTLRSLFYLLPEGILAVALLAQKENQPGVKSTSLFEFFIMAQLVYQPIENTLKLAINLILSKIASQFGKYGAQFHAHTRLKAEKSYEEHANVILQALNDTLKSALVNRSEYGRLESKEDVSDHEVIDETNVIASLIKSAINNFAQKQFGIKDFCDKQIEPSFMTRSVGRFVVESASLVTRESKSDTPQSTGGWIFQQLTSPVRGYFSGSSSRANAPSSSVRPGSPPEANNSATNNDLTQHPSCATGAKKFR